ncbi:MAG: mycofactocin biosynthesis peptidyl-dipeptidase MftE [Acidimicrobiales bacterium]
MSDLGLLTSDGAASATLLLVPLGATEQHGPHLALATDTIIAKRWADAVAMQLNQSGVRALVAPPLPYGSSGEHQMFPGTLSIGHQALELLLIELIRSAGNTFDRVALLSGHAGNVEPVTAAVTQMVVEGHDVRCFFPTWDRQEGWSIDAHAGRTETALMLHLEPDQVLLDRIAPGDTRPLSDIMPTLIADGVAAVSPSGVLGDPTDADAEEGQKLFAELVDRTTAQLLSR